MTEAFLGRAPSDCLFVCEVFQFSIWTDWTHSMLKEANLSLFYLTIKLYLWGQSCQFSAVWGRSECVSSKGFLSALAWTEWLTGSLLETSNHPSLLPHWPVYSKLSLVQPFSFTHHSCRRNSTDHRMLEAQWCWNTNVKHFTNADSVLGSRFVDERLNRQREKLP